MIFLFLVDVSRQSAEPFRLHEMHHRNNRGSATPSPSSPHFFERSSTDSNANLSDESKRRPSSSSLSSSSSSAEHHSSFTVLDASKHAVEYFMKLLQKRKDIRGSLKTALFTTDNTGPKVYF